MCHGCFSCVSSALSKIKDFGYILLQLLVICYEVHYPVNDIIFCNFWIDNTSPYLFAQAITKYHRLDGLNNRHLFLSVGCLKVQDQCVNQSDLWWGQSLSVFLLTSYFQSHHEGPTLGPHLTLITSKGPITKCHHIERVSTHKFGYIIQSIAIPMVQNFKRIKGYKQ